MSPEVRIFIDDMAVNCRGAEAVGMQSHLFDITKPEDSITSLLDRLGLGGEGLESQRGASEPAEEERRRRGAGSGQLG